MGQELFTAVDKSTLDNEEAAQTTSVTPVALSEIFAVAHVLSEYEGDNLKLDLIGRELKIPIIRFSLNAENFDAKRPPLPRLLANQLASAIEEGNFVLGKEFTYGRQLRLLDMNRKTKEVIFMIIDEIDNDITFHF